MARPKRKEVNSKKSRIVPRPSTKHTQIKQAPSPTYYKDKANPKSYSFSVESQFLFEDKLPLIHKLPLSSTARSQFKMRIINRLQITCSENAFVLHDCRGTPRFVVGYRRGKDKALEIWAIQRMRTQYTETSRSMHGFPEGVKFRWSNELETQASKKFQVELGGMHPSDFLLSEFIYQHRAELKRKIEQGKPALLLHTGAMSTTSYNVTVKDLHKLYGPIIKKFFGKYDEKAFGWPLNPNKKRVKAILGL